MRDKLIQSFGGVGFGLWLILGFCLSYMPLWFIPIHGLLLLAIIAVIMFVPIVGGIANFILWVVSFPVVLNGPQDELAIAYYIVFSIYIIFNVIPILLNIPIIANILGEIKLIKPKYYIRENAPLRFLKVLRVLLKICAGLQILSFIIYIIPAIGRIGEYGIASLIPCAISIGSIILTIAVFENLENWKWLGVKLLYLLWFLSCALSMANQMLQRGADWSIAIGCLLGWLIWMAPMYIYFAKRRPLFDPPITAIPQQQYTQQEAQMKQFVVDDATGEVISETPVEEPKPVVLTYAPDFKLSGPPKLVADEPVPQEPSTQPKPSKRNAVLFVVLAVLCVASLAGNAVQGYMGITQKSESLSKESEMQEEIDSLNKKITSLNAENNRINKKLSDALDDSGTKLEMLETLAPEAFAMETYIGFIYDGSKYCHSYNCAQFPFEDCDEFTAHNVEYCEWLGYPKHSGCWD